MVVDPLARLAEPPIFIVGSARSGSTWIYDVLTAHPQVGGVLESWLFTSGAGLAGLWGPLHWPHRAVGLGRVLSQDELAAEMRAFSSRILARALKPRHRFLVEKSGAHASAMELIATVFPGARFIHALRDGRDVAVSYRSASRSWAPGWRPRRGPVIARAAREWKHLVRTARRNGAALGDRYLEIRYESLKRDLLGSYRRLFDFCAIPYDDELLKRVFERTDFDRNFQADESAFRRGGRIGDWRTHFSLRDALIFAAVAQDALVETGYARDLSWVTAPVLARCRDRDADATA